MYIYKFFNCIYIFFSNRSSLLVALISMEMLMLFMLVMNYFFYFKMGLVIYFTMCFLVMMVVEGVLGLSLLIFMVRMTGNSRLKSLSLSKW